MRWVKELGRSVGSVVSFATVVWKWRWYDYGYSIDVLVRMLEMQVASWDKAHYVGSEFTKGRMLVLLRWYKKSKEGSMWDERRYEDKFLKGYARNARKFWD